MRAGSLLDGLQLELNALGTDTLGYRPAIV
jgi:hypothetical protein